MTRAEKDVAVIGGGPAGLMAAEHLARAGHEVTVYEQGTMVGRKFLMAGRGGLNLTHSEPLENFLTRYGTAAAQLRPLIADFGPAALRAWCEGLGQPTFVGSSGRVFPESFKASPLLRAWRARLQDLGVGFALGHVWRGWDDEGRLQFAGPDGVVVAVRPKAALLALGGASWPRLGSTGGWAGVLASRGVELTPFRPANCGFDVSWSVHMIEHFAGVPLKPVALSFAGQRIKGEAMVTAHGLEGGAIYALSALLRDAIEKAGRAVLVIDLKPDLARDELARRLAKPQGRRSLGHSLRKAVGLSPVAAALLREDVGGELSRVPDALAALIKAVQVTLTAPRPIDRAISTAGGVVLSAVDEHLMLKALPGVFVAGEMLDWEAPTGGYLLQACFATGLAAAKGAAAWITGGVG